jgi:hypothetical protein
MKAKDLVPYLAAIGISAIVFVLVYFHWLVADSAAGFLNSVEQNKEVQAKQESDFVKVVYRIRSGHGHDRSSYSATLWINKSQIFGLLPSRDLLDSTIVIGIVLPTNIIMDQGFDDVGPGSLIVIYNENGENDEFFDWVMTQTGNHYLGE